MQQDRAWWYRRSALFTKADAHNVGSTRREARFGAGLAVVTNLMVLGTATPVRKFEQECDGLWREAQNLFGPMPSYMVY